MAIHPSRTLRSGHGHGHGAPVALSIAGSDSSGGAGIQADLKTFGALGVYGASAITAITAQNTVGVQAIHDVPPDVVAAQIASVLDDLEVRAIKIGMLSNAGVIEAVAGALEGVSGIPVVLDPVMVAKSGDALLHPDAVRSLLERLCPLATLLTPNAPEAKTLLGLPEATDATALEARAQGFGSASVLLKGGHFEGDEIVDLLVHEGRTTRFVHARVATANTHGTGCTLSSAIAAHLARGLDLERAVASAETWLQRAIRGADALAIGRGHGPVHHFHALWPVDVDARAPEFPPTP